MKRRLINSLIFILVLMLVILFVLGLKSNSFGIESYLNLEKKALNISKQIKEVEENYKNEFESKKKELSEVVKKYETEKLKYETKSKNLQVGIEEVKTAFDLYDIDFLWTIIGNYATEEGVILKLDVSNVSDNMGFLNENYILCDLYFSVSGDYLSITDFIYDLEDDERLNFEIRDFEVKKSSENLEAKFIIKSVPINRKNLSKIEDRDIIDTAKENYNEEKTENTIVQEKSSL